MEIVLEPGDDGDGDVHGCDVLWFGIGQSRNSMTSLAVSGLAMSAQLMWPLFYILCFHGSF